MESKVSRLFVAIALPDAVRALLMAAQRELMPLLPLKSAAWSQPDSMHLTLRFLGNVESTRIPELSQQLGAGLAGFGEFDVVCERLGCFPDLRSPRVVWAWVHDADEHLVRLHRRVNQLVQDFSKQLAAERFVGHITLARPRQIKRPDAERLAQFVARAATRRFGDWHVPSVTLFCSQLSATGARYAELSHAHLR